MSLVTPQGIGAQLEFDNKVEQLSQKLYERLGALSLAPKDLKEAFKDDDEDTLQEAMWLLLDDGRAEITGDRRLRRLPD